MNPATAIAIDILTKLEADGYLKPDTRWKNPTLLPALIAIIDSKLAEQREEFAKFCIWWAEIIHIEHKNNPDPAAHHAPDFWHCTYPMCSSLVGTIADLAYELKTNPRAIVTLP